MAAKGTNFPPDGNSHEEKDITLLIRPLGKYDRPIWYPVKKKKLQVYQTNFKP